MASEALPDAQPFRLLNLPPGLRNRTYEVMVVRQKVELVARGDGNADAELSYKTDSMINTFRCSDDMSMLGICLCNH